MTATFLVARSERTVFVRSTGLANMKNSPVLDVFLATEIDQGATTICVDLSSCSGMDSTFMGLLVGYARQLDGAGGRLVVVNPSVGNMRLLVMLGVTLVVPVLENQPDPQVAYVTLASDPTMSPIQRIELVQRAHQNLLKLTKSNEAKFAAFLTALERDLAKIRAAAAAPKSAGDAPQQRPPKPG
ncbi:MAG: STAS domain-containing protein [Planctomycetes bacterium]|nr:STAS domain-containing protein [Planctomycetota bacterium]